MTVSPLRLIVADDHAVVRAGLRAPLEGEADLEVVGEAAGPEEAVRLAVELAPDVVLMDLRFEGVSAMPGRPTASRRCALAARAPDVPVVMLTSYSGRVDVVRALEAGARGYVPKAGPPEISSGPCAAPRWAGSGSRPRWSATSPVKWSTRHRS